jgi:hypothetical protein
MFNYKQYNKEYYIENKEKMNKQGKAWYEANKEHCRVTAKNWRSEYYPKHKNNLNSKSADYYQKNKELINKKCKERITNWTEERKNKEKLRQLKYLLEHKDQTNKRMQERYYSNPHNRIVACMRSRICMAIRSALTYKQAKTTELLGCTIQDFLVYIESQFKPNMSWDNYGKGIDKWNIDHIIPCASFDLTKLEEQQKCFHHTNCQPLWSIENSKKRDKL